MAEWRDIKGILKNTVSKKQVYTKILDIGDLDGNGKYNINDFLIMQNEEIIKMNNGQKFDICLMNPPYGKMLPFEFLNKCLDIANTTIYIGPIGKIRSIIESNKLTERINKHCKEYNIIKNFGELFNITQRETSGILVVDQNEYNNAYRYSYLLPIYKKMKAVLKENKIKSLRSSCIHNKTKYSIPMQGDNGYAKGWHMTLQQIHQATKNTIAQISFNTQTELDNYLDSLNYWPYKLIYLIDDNSAVPAHLPFMNDYKEKWSNKKFCEYFNISGYISDNKAKKDSEWEIIINTIKNNE